MKRPLCRFFTLAMGLYMLAGCTVKNDTPNGYLTTISEKQGTKSVVEPVWLDPAAGTITPVCGEDVHGADCPFAGFDTSVRSYLTQDDGGMIYFFTEGTDKNGEKTADLWEYRCKTGKRKKIDSRTDTLWRSKTLLKDGYLFQWERDENDARYAITCMDLSDRNHEKYPIPEIPMAITEQERTSAAYYTLCDTNGYPCGFYSADWMFPPQKTPRELLFYDSNCRINGLWFEDDAIYWRGQMRFIPEDSDRKLYRYDMKTYETTEVCGDAFGGFQAVGCGEFFYYLQHVTYPDGERESRCVFSRLRKTTGESKVLFTLPEEWKADGAPHLYHSWVIVCIAHMEDDAEGFFCWNIDTGEGKILPAERTQENHQN